LGTTVTALELQTGIPAKETAEMSEIKELYEKANYPGKFKDLYNKDAVKKYLYDRLKQNEGKKLKFAIGYLHPGAKVDGQTDRKSDGHVVMVKAWMMNGEFKYRAIDCQLGANGERFEEKNLSLPETNYYWLWETDMLYKSKPKN
jgi:hypothetical protein